MQVCEAVKSGKVKDYRDVEYSNVKFLNGGDQGISAFAQSERLGIRVLNETSPKYKEMVAS
jgi:hypothetical protein